MKSSERNIRPLGIPTGSQKPFDMFTPINGRFPSFFECGLTVNFWRFIRAVNLNMDHKCTMHFCTSLKNGLKAGTAGLT